MDEQKLSDIIASAVEGNRGQVDYPDQSVYCSMREPVQMTIYIDGRFFRVHIEGE